jgi:hypothetical protein
VAEGRRATAGRGRPIRASEVGEYLYCARAWRLRRDGVEPTAAGRARLEAGTRWHLEHGAGVRRALLLRRLSAACLLLAIVAATLVLLIWWRA